MAYLHDWGPLKQICQETYVFFWWRPFTTSPASPASCPVPFAKGLARNMIRLDPRTLELKGRFTTNLYLNGNTKHALP